MVRTENASKPATKRQLWALFLASKNAGRTHDYRNDGLTMQQASELLDKFKSGTTTATATPQKSARVSADEQLERDFREYVENHYVNAAVKQLEQVLKQVSIIQDDPTTTKKPKRYIFFGSGCSIGYVTWDRRGKKGEKIDDVSRKVRQYAFSLVSKKIGKKKVDELRRMGSPAEAILYQDYEMNNLWLQVKRTFMEKCGVKNVQIHINYD